MAQARNRIFVGGISWKTDEATLKSFFSTFGTVTECKIITDRDTGKSKGYGFVTFEERQAADRVKQRDNLSFMGKTLNIHDAFRRSDQDLQPATSGVAVAPQTQPPAHAVPSGSTGPAKTGWSTPATNDSQLALHYPSLQQAAMASTPAPSTATWADISLSSFHNVAAGGAQTHASRWGSADEVNVGGRWGSGTGQRPGWGQKTGVAEGSSQEGMLRSGWSPSGPGPSLSPLLPPGLRTGLEDLSPLSTSISAPSTYQPPPSPPASDKANLGGGGDCGSGSGGGGWHHSKPRVPLAARWQAKPLPVPPPWQGGMQAAMAWEASTSAGTHATNTAATTPQEFPALRERPEQSHLT